MRCAQRVKTRQDCFVQQTFCDVTELIAWKITYSKRMEQMPLFNGKKNALFLGSTRTQARTDI